MSFSSGPEMAAWKAINERKCEEVRRMRELVKDENVWVDSMELHRYLTSVISFGQAAGSKDVNDEAVELWSRLRDELGRKRTGRWPRNISEPPDRVNVECTQCGMRSSARLHSFPFVAFRCKCGATSNADVRHFFAYSGVPV